MSGEPKRPGGRPKRRARKAGDVSGPASYDPSLPVHKAAEERARSYSWEPFQAGNALGIRHGAASERVVGPLAGQLAAWIVAEYPDLGEPRYAFAVSAWARAEARAALLSLFLDVDGIVEADGDRRGEARDGLLEQVRREERRAAEERKNLGLNPAAHAALERERAEAVKGAVDLGELQRRGAEALRSRLSGELRALGGGDRGEGEAS